MQSIKPPTFVGYQKATSITCTMNASANLLGERLWATDTNTPTRAMFDTWAKPIAEMYAKKENERLDSVLGERGLSPDAVVMWLNNTMQESATIESTRKNRADGPEGTWLLRPYCFVAASCNTGTTSFSHAMCVKNGWVMDSIKPTKAKRVRTFNDLNAFVINKYPGKGTRVVQVWGWGIAPSQVKIAKKRKAVDLTDEEPPAKKVRITKVPTKQNTRVVLDLT